MRKRMLQHASHSLLGMIAVQADVHSGSAPHAPTLALGERLTVSGKFSLELFTFSL